jgi:hypothetical protein
LTGKNPLYNGFNKFLGAHLEPVKLWLDDVRKMPEDFDFWAKTVEEAKTIIMERGVTHISFDHDLGLMKEDGIELAKWLEWKAYHGLGKQLIWKIHSANPVGAKNIGMTMESCDRLWERRNNGKG